jgi:hypothetical protein
VEGWNIGHDGKDGWVLMNKTETVWQVNRRCGLNNAELLSRLEAIGFPLAYTEGLKRIRFTYLKPKVYGLYGDDEIDIDVRKGRDLRLVVETFVHEVAHHIDSEDDISGELTHERKMRGKHIRHRTALTSDAEYFARGFERFYSEDPKDKRELRHHNPKLYAAILKLHRRYSEEA